MARSIMEKSIKLNIGDIDVLFNIAKCLEMMDRPDEAIEYYKRALASMPGNEDVYIAMVAIETKRGNIGRAMDLCREGLKFHPENGELHGRLGTLLYQTGQGDEAIKELEEAVKLRVDSTIYCNYAVTMLAKGEIEKAAKYFNMAIKLNPANAEAHFNLGNIFLSKQLSEKAADEYKMAVKTNPNYTKALINLGVASEQMGQLDNAIENYRHAIKSDPNIAVAHFNLAVTLSRKGLMDEAVEHMHKYLEFEPQDAAARCKYAEMLLLQDKVERAIAEYEQVLKIDPADKDARAGLEKIRNSKTTSDAIPAK
jgi:tetratricopeptide (TPR) repeat protein